MNYLAPGDSISIDDYTGVVGGGAASPLARLNAADAFQNLMQDGFTIADVLQSLGRVAIRPDVTTLTAGGNDFLLAASFGAKPSAAAGRRDLVHIPLRNLRRIADELIRFDCEVILNTIDDPTDGDDSLAGELGVTPAHRLAHPELNEGIRKVAALHGFLLSDLAALFAGYGVAARDSWIVRAIEPNLAGATVIASHWHSLLRDSSRVKRAPI